jgi:hypothetical protein
MTETEIKKPLEEKLKEIYTAMPEVKPPLEPYRMASWGMHWSGSVQDAALIKVGEYTVAAAKWEEHEYSEDGGGIQWNEWVSCNYQKKGGKLHEQKQNAIVTRDRNTASKDRRDLWEYDYVKITPDGDKKVRVSWCDAKGREGPGIDVKLEEL